MDDKTKIIMAAIGVLLVVASSGVTFLLQPTGSNLRCSSGWSFLESGEFEGQYECVSASNVRHSYCSDVWDTSTGRENYWCAEAVPVIVEQKNDVVVDPVARVGSYKCYVDGCDV